MYNKKCEFDMTNDEQDPDSKVHVTYYELEIPIVKKIIPISDGVFIKIAQFKSDSLYIAYKEDFKNKSSEPLYLNSKSEFIPCMFNSERFECIENVLVGIRLSDIDLPDDIEED